MNRLETNTSQTCENCGGHITTDYARVFGDQADTVHRCPNCTSFGEIADGRAAGLNHGRSVGGDA